MGQATVPDPIHPLPPTREAAAARRTLQRIGTVAVLGIGLGLLMQVLIVIARILSGGPWPGLAIAVETAQTVSWVALVCSGVAIAIAVGRARRVLAGLVAALCAPLALAAAKALQKLVAELIDAPQTANLIPIETVSLIRGIEYGLLAWLLALLVHREVARMPPYLWTGTGVGLVFGGAVTALLTQAHVGEAGALSPVFLSGTLVAEMGTPIGCALVIYVGQAVAGAAKVFWGPGVRAK